MNNKHLFARMSNVQRELVEGGASLETLKQEYHIDSTINYPFSDNWFLFCSDDSGTPCLTLIEFQNFLKKLDSIRMPKSDRDFVLGYVNSRISRYHSPRRGHCVALRGVSYYRMFQGIDRAAFIRHLKQDLLDDGRVYHFLSRFNRPLPQELTFMVVEHLKNALFHIMYAYMIKSLNVEGFFDDSHWNILDGMARTFWELLVNIVFNQNYILPAQGGFDPLCEIVSQLSDSSFGKVRELDSAKTLLRMADLQQRSDLEFDCCIPLFYGGIEIGYAMSAYGVFTKKRGFSSIIPFVFSLNRLRKGVITTNVLEEDGLLRWDLLGKITSDYFINKLANNTKSRVLVVDNNMTTGYSLRVIVESLRKYSFECEAAVAEVNIGEIQSLCQGAFEDNRQIVLSGSELCQPPVGEYVTCYGLKDKSQVVGRIKTVLGLSGHTQIEGYDFDGTLFKTGFLHRESWNKALASLGVDYDVVNIPSNSGLTYYQAALNIYRHLTSIGILVSLSEAEFAEELCEAKLKFILELKPQDVIPIAKTVNLVTSDTANTKIIITNNRLVFVLHCLKKKRLLGYFSHLICEDYAYCVKSRERVAMVGERKPSVAAYREASEYFNLPVIQAYYGDDKEIDREFAHSLKCIFHLIG